MKRKRGDTAGQLSAVAALRAKRKDSSNRHSQLISPPEGEGFREKPTKETKIGTESNENLPQKERQRSITPQLVHTSSVTPITGEENISTTFDHGAAAGVDDYDSSSSDAESQYRQRDEQLSTVHLSPSNVDSATAIALSISLKLGESIVLIGQYDIWVKKGAVSVLGANLFPSKRLHRIYAPSTHALPVIRCESQQNAQIDILSTHSGIRSLREFSPLFGGVWNDRRTGCETMTPPDILRKRSFSVLQRSSDDPRKRNLSKFVEHLDWSRLHVVLSQSTTTISPRLMICGAKWTGKSTLCQYLVNHAITACETANGELTKLGSAKSVAVLDLDPSQPLFCPPGHTSLCHVRIPVFGPSFVHPNVAPSSPNRLIKAHHVGLLSLKGDPYYYFDCALDLLKHYERLLDDFPSCSLVVNTPAWISGTTLEILRDLVSSLSITDLIITTTSAVSEEPLLNVPVPKGVRVTSVEASPSDLTTRVSHELYTMHMMSYFHTSRSERFNLTWHRHPINAIRPWIVPYGGGDDERPIFAVLTAGDNIDNGNLYETLDGTVVAMVVIENSNDPPSSPPPTQQQPTPMVEDGDDSDSLRPGKSQHPGQLVKISRCPKTNIPYLRKPPPLPPSQSLEQAPPLNDPSKSCSLGLALIRAIDLQTQSFHITTPIPASAIASTLRLTQTQTQPQHRNRNQKILLVESNFEAPGWAFEEPIYASMMAAGRKKRWRGKGGEEEAEAENERREETPWVGKLSDLGAGVGT